MLNQTLDKFIKLVKKEMKSRPEEFEAANLSMDEAESLIRKMHETGDRSVFFAGYSQIDANNPAKLQEIEARDKLSLMVMTAIFEEIPVYSTVVGELPEIVKNGEPMVLVPHAEVKRLLKLSSQKCYELSRCSGSTPRVIDDIENLFTKHFGDVTITPKN